MIYRENSLSKRVTSGQISKYWTKYPVSTRANPYRAGTREYFSYYDILREESEPVEFSSSLHEYKNFKGKKVLDVGCGNGYVLSRYAMEGAETCGVDIANTAVDLCGKRFEYLGLKGDFKMANAESLPFAGETFDCVCSMGVLHHVQDTQKGIQEIHRVLKRGGRLIVMMYHKDSWRYRVKMRWVSKATGKSMERLVNEVDGIGNPKGEVYTKDELRDMLNEFKDLELFAGLLRGYMILPNTIGRLIPAIALRPFEKRFGWFLYAKGIKP